MLTNLTSFVSSVKKKWSNQFSYMITDK